MSSSAPKTQTVTQTNNPPSYAKPYLEDVLKEAQGLYRDGGPEFYPGSTVVPMSPETQMALDAQKERAINGNPLLTQAQDYTSSVLSGDYLSAGNPYFQNAFNAMSGATTDAVMAAMARSGRLGSGAETAVLSKELGNIGAKLAFGNYERERGVMDQASQYAPQLAMMDYEDIARLGQVGSAWESQAGAELQDDIDRFTFYQQKPWDKLAQYATLVNGGTYGGQSTTTQPVYSSRAGSFLGGAASGAGIGSSFGPWGAGIGAGVGGLLSLFG